MAVDSHVAGVTANAKIHPNNPQSAQRITAKQRRAQVMEYKLLGASIRQIAEKLGMGPRGCIRSCARS